MAFDYKKEYKDLYMPKCAPVQADVPAMGYFCVRGKGNPNTCEDYKAALEILYGLSFTVKMSKMSGDTPAGYFEYVVPPLEGFWWMEEDGDPADKDKYCWLSMIRQPEFVDGNVFAWAKERLFAKNRSWICRKRNSALSARDFACRRCTSEVTTTNPLHLRASTPTFAITAWSAREGITTRSIWAIRAKSRPKNCARYCGCPYAKRRFYETEKYAVGGARFAGFRRLL